MVILGLNLVGMFEKNIISLPAGVLVIGLGLFALLAGLAGLGIINPLFNI